ncbi:hypothetical protein M0813_19580 [Anaeramoeba flamelloides]|uniref:LOV domain-containing protein n=1 Tax=Anaeramoeba flamelloides TaxID=1746091 RepID=A0ABQ8YNK2_9EUKA|nr:hypothetical protein M0813_19580 [Anaeramoeba flamelloides]
MGNHGSKPKEIQIPESRILAYFKIFHQMKTPLMLLDGKHMSLIDINNTCSSLLGMQRKDICLSLSTFKFWPPVQKMYQNQPSKQFLKHQLKKLNKNKNKTEFIFECNDQEGASVWSHFSVTKINMWHNSIYQIIISRIQNPFSNLSQIEKKKQITTTNLFEKKNLKQKVK